MSLSMVDVINRSAYRGMSDDGLADEREAQAILYTAIADFFGKLQEVNRLSRLIQVDGLDFANYVHDEIPSRATWDERIAKARNP